MLKRLKFGTAGLRARMGAGYNAMNDVVVLQTAQGLCSYLKKFCNPSQIKNGEVIGFDGRYNSKRFAELTAKVFITASIPVHIFSRVCPTPLVSFGTILYDASAGVMVTASHNPKEDNGYKVYWRNGCQILPPHDEHVLEEVKQTLDVNVKDNKNSTTYQPIADFYSGKSVFVTGGTGFLGKVFLEKLLYSCNKLDKVYLLVREKRGENVNKRIEDLFANPLFSRLKTSNPDYVKKVVPITGDVALPNLGLSPKDEQKLIDKVSVVYHAAATVRFDEPLAVAMNINFEGTQQILELSRRMKNMEAFVYISTAFAQSQRNVLVETVYPPPAQVDDVYKFIEEYGHDTQETKKFLSDKGKPNTYTLTKALAESYIAKNHGDVPTVIIRPSVVASTKDEPVKGWVDNWYGGTYLLFSTAKGWNRFHLGSASNTIDFIPVDYVSNLSIIAGARAKISKDVQVFNSTTTSENPVMWSDVYKYFGREMISQGKNDVPYPFAFFEKSKSMVHIGTFLLQTTPAHIADLLLIMKGKEPRYAKLVYEVATKRNALNYFISRPWMMRAERVRELYSSLSPEDKKMFPCDPTQIEWSEYFRDYCKGVQKYLKSR